MNPGVCECAWCGLRQDKQDARGILSTTVRAEYKGGGAGHGTEDQRGILHSTCTIGDVSAGK